MLPLAGSNPTLPGYDQWLSEVSSLHHKLQFENRKNVSRWLSTNWQYWFQQGLPPREAIEAARADYEKWKLKCEFWGKYGMGRELPDELK